MSLEGRKQSFTSMEKYYKRRTWATSKHTRRRQDAKEGMLTELWKAVEMVANPVAELRSAVEMITNKMSKMQDLEKDLERTKRIVEALRARPTGSSEAQPKHPKACLLMVPRGCSGGSGKPTPEKSNLKLRDPTWMVALTTNVRPPHGCELPI